MTPSDKKKWHEIEKILNPGLKSSSQQKSNVPGEIILIERQSFASKENRKGGKFNFRDRKKDNFRDKLNVI